MEEKGHAHWTAPGCEVMIRPFIQHLLSTSCAHVPGPGCGWGQGPSKCPPSTAQGQISLWVELPGETTDLLHPNYHKIIKFQVWVY